MLIFPLPSRLWMIRKLFLHSLPRQPWIIQMLKLQCPKMFKQCCIWLFFSNRSEPYTGDVFAKLKVAHPFFKIQNVKKDVQRLQQNVKCYHTDKDLASSSWSSFMLLFFFLIPLKVLSCTLMSYLRIAEWIMNCLGPYIKSWEKVCFDMCGLVKYKS